jgi:hypothetical protein
MINQKKFLNYIILNDINKVEEILINTSNLDYLSAFILSAKYSRIKITKLFLEHTKVNVSDNNNWAIRYYIKHGNIPLVKTLINHESFNVDNNGHNFIHYSIFNKHYELLSLLLNNDKINPSHYNNSAIKISIENNDYKAIELLINSDNFDHKLQASEIILLSLLSNKTNIVKLLLDKLYFNENYLVAFFYGSFNCCQFNSLKAILLYIEENKINIESIDSKLLEAMAINQMKQNESKCFLDKIFHFKPMRELIKLHQSNLYIELNKSFVSSKLYGF